MRTFRLWASLALALALAGAAGWAYWTFEVRWRPTLITRHQQEIAALLQSSGWVAPGLAGKKLYMVSFRAAPEGERVMADDFPGLQKKGVDTRVIVIARPDLNGQAQSTPAERATVAQLWLGRDWSLLTRWVAVPATAWTAPGLPRADGDMARTAVVEAGRGLVDRLGPLLKDNGFAFAYPTLVWWNDKGEMRACACTTRQAQARVLRDLGV